VGIFGNDFSEMLGRTVTAVHASKGGTRVGFDTDQGHIEYGIHPTDIMAGISQDRQNLRSRRPESLRMIFNAD
jgi:hypothetical protein